MIYAADTEIELKNERLKIKQGGSYFEIGGVLQLDYSRFDGVYNGGELGTATEIRTASISIKRRLKKRWIAKLKFEFNEAKSTTEIKDAYIRYSPLKTFSLTMGKVKEPFGLEEQTGSSQSTFIESAMMTDAFAPGRNKGILFSYAGYGFTGAMGGFQISHDEENHKEAHSTTGRFTYAYEDEGFLFHIGGSYSVQDLNGQVYKIKERAEVHGADKIVNSKDTQAERVTLKGAELASVLRSFSLQGEYVETAITPLAGSPVSYKGYYIQGSFFLTGESPSYKKGVFLDIKPNSKDIGAYEIVSRYSKLDAIHEDTGRVASTITIGLNHYIDEQIRIMGNAMSTTLENSEYKGEGDAFSLRIQYQF